jgi:hypothetical protein
MNMKSTFPAGIHHHQNNSFDEFREGGYARAHHEDVALWNGTSVGNCSLSFSKSKNWENSLENNSGLESKQVGRKHMGSG